MTMSLFALNKFNTCFTHFCSVKLVFAAGDRFYLPLNSYWFSFGLIRICPHLRFNLISGPEAKKCPVQLFKQITFPFCTLLQDKFKILLVNGDEFPKGVCRQKVCLRTSLVHSKTISVWPLLNNINISEHITRS